MFMAWSFWLRFPGMPLYIMQWRIMRTGYIERDIPFPVAVSFQTIVHPATNVGHGASISFL